MQQQDPWRGSQAEQTRAFDSLALAREALLRRGTSVHPLSRSSLDAGDDGARRMLCGGCLTWWNSNFAK